MMSALWRGIIGLCNIYLILHCVNVTLQMVKLPYVHTCSYLYMVNIIHTIDIQWKANQGEKMNKKCAMQKTQDSTKTTSCNQSVAVAKLWLQINEFTRTSSPDTGMWLNFSSHEFQTLWTGPHPMVQMFQWVVPYLHSQHQSPGWEQLQVLAGDTNLQPVPAWPVHSWGSGRKAAAGPVCAPCLLGSSHLALPQFPTEPKTLKCQHGIIMQQHQWHIGRSQGYAMRVDLK